MPRRPRCHLAHTRGGSQRAFHPAGLRFNTIHFIFPTTQNWIKAAPVRGKGWREGRGSFPMDHPPPSPPSRPTAGGHAVGVVGAGPLLLARVSSGPKAGLGEAARAGHTPPANCPSEARGAGDRSQLGCCFQFWAGLWGATASSWAVRHTWPQVGATVRAHSLLLRSLFLAKLLLGTGCWAGRVWE